MKPICAIASLLMMSVACDTDSLKRDLDELEGRVESLEEQFALMNDNINGVIRLMSGNQTIKSCAKDDVSGEWTLVLVDSEGKEETITLNQGSAGQFVYPEISVDDNGHWIFNGQDLGVAVGKDGKAPELRINPQTMFWEYRYDEAEEWQGFDPPVSAEIEGGSETQGDTFFGEIGITEDGKYLEFTLKNDPDGKKYRLPIIDAVLSCEISTPVSGYENGFWTFAYGASADVDVTLSGAEDIVVSAPSGWSAGLNEDNTVLTVTAPALPSVQTRAGADNSSDVVIEAYADGLCSVAKISVKAEFTGNYEAFVNGGSITIGDREILKSDYADEDIHHITAADGIKTISGAGIWFIDADAEGVVFSGNLDLDKDFIIVGQSSSERPEISADYMVISQNEAVKVIAFKDAHLKVSGGESHNTEFLRIKDSTLDDVIFDNCIVESVNDYFDAAIIYFSGDSDSSEIDCGRVLLQGNLFYFGVLNGSKGNTAVLNSYRGHGVINSAVIDNNVVYVGNNSTYKTLKCISLGSPEKDAANTFIVKTMKMTDNSLLNIKNAHKDKPMITSAVENMEISGNLFYCNADRGMRLFPDKDMSGNGSKIVQDGYYNLLEVSNSNYYFAIKNAEQVLNGSSALNLGMLADSDKFVQLSESPFATDHAFNFDDLSSFCVEGVDYGAHIK